MRRTIKEAMHRGVVTCKVSSTAAEIARTMLDNDVSAVVVTDERQDTCAVVTKTDLLRCYGKYLPVIEAEGIMSAGLLMVSPNSFVHEAVQLMLDKQVHQLVIVTGGGVHHRPIGIFTSGNAVALMAGESGPRSEAQIRCSECTRRLLAMSPDEKVQLVDGGGHN